MNIKSIITIISSLATGIKDPKTLFYHTFSTVLILGSVYVLNNLDTIGEFLANFSSTQVIEKYKEAQRLEYPKLAKNKAELLFYQVSPSEVFVAEYNPKFINEYQTMVASVGSLNISAMDIRDQSINKNSTAYAVHLQQEDYAWEVKAPNQYSWVKGDFITSGVEYSRLGIKYLYTCPIFNLDNMYSGYIGIAWREVPYKNNKEKEGMEQYLHSICMPASRLLGRSK